MTPHSFAPINVVDGLHFALRYDPGAGLGVWGQLSSLMVEFQGVTGQYSRSLMTVHPDPKKPFE